MFASCRDDLRLRCRSPHGLDRCLRASQHHRDDTGQLEFAADVVVDGPDEVEERQGMTRGPIDAEVLPWKPAFDQTDDLDGLLEARGPLLARAFGGQGRRRPTA